jgi:hypothetical protein
VLDDPAVDDAREVEHREVDRAAARRPEERAGRPAPTVHPDPDAIAGLRRVLDVEPQAGHGPVHVPDGRLDRGKGSRPGAGQPELVLDQVRRAELVDDRVISGGEALVEHPAQDVEGSSGGHDSPLRCSSSTLTAVILHRLHC